ncbi:23S rRNA (adenine(2503)-C(2))-methyltransferase RlmN [Desulfolucanica intricata]|uniref:23S rRNA (adenine(2503)-C(2))-methyltransferase RlmN n=1 Tax=Desulfolucanica intricata TaxID=1285191 RepID=UPI00082EA58D|nr:23S rRNA (adenine(2503)-C(2))-methyltransferase RlmN [Desulfolucanica intricata]
MNLTLKQMEEWVAQYEMPKFRARQIAEWVFKKGITSFEQMTNLPLEFRSKLREVAYLENFRIIKKQVSGDEETVKYLFELKDGQAVESVLMKHSYGHSVCVSTQVGCRMACRLCASSLEGLVRNLSSGEIYEQVLAIQRDQGDQFKVSHIVIMGAGEPLDNFDNTLKFLENINASYGLNIGYRHITLSTCGIVPRIRELAERKLPITLAISLHAPNDELRDYIVPVNKKYPINELLAVCRDYIFFTGRRISFEYALVAGFNDQINHAAELADLLKDLFCHINLIPVNPVKERGLEKTSPKQVNHFKEILESKGLTVTIRREMGADIDAACGQLRRRVLAGQKDVFKGEKS